jgi:diadenosine tetraphosphate (Ap4A) HIT family hydrolase
MLPRGGADCSDEGASCHRTGAPAQSASGAGAVWSEPVRTWPDDWERRRSGHQCPVCAEGRPDVDAQGNIRWFAGEVSDTYLRSAGPAAGYSIVVWRGLHVADVSEMTSGEATAYWLEVMRSARAISAVFAPCHLNYNLLGNAVPHAHTHIVPRYLDDTSPERPLVWCDDPVEPVLLREQVARLRDAVA